MRIEAPTETLHRFAKDASWLSQPVETIANDLKSSGNESRREWDAFYYEEREGHLFDPVRGKNIVGTDGGDEAQKRVNKELEDWFITHDSGIAARISPRGGMYHYPDEQIEIYRITYTWPDLQKKLFCSFRGFHAYLQNPEEIRQVIFTEDDSENAIFEIIGWVEKKSQKKVEASIHNSGLRSEQAYYYASMLKSGENPGDVFEHMDRSGFLGEHAIGCGGSNIISAVSTDSYSSTTTPVPIFESYDYSSGWHDGTCRNCGANTWVGPCNICAPCASRM